MSDGEDESGVFGDGDEFGGGDESLLGVLPADEGFEAFDVAGLEGDNGLIHEEELVCLEGLAEVVFEVEPVLDALAHGDVEEHVAAFACELGFIHGGVSVA